MPSGGEENGKQGSSPRVRGIEGDEKDVVYIDRIIPACAGNRGSGSEAASSRRDHPRVCGE